MASDKGALNRVQVIAGSRKPFDGEDLASVRLYGKREASAGRPAIKKYGAATADTVLAPYMCARQPQFVAEKVREEAACVHLP
jgi:hypothetical protein